MKSIPLAALTLALPLVLSGCSSSPSIEEQAKLVEYEQCLKMSVDEYNRLILEVIEAFSKSDFEKRAEFSVSKDFKKAFQTRLEACKHLHP